MDLISSRVSSTIMEGYLVIRLLSPAAPSTDELRETVTNE
jgi:hypothetical protein